MGVERNVVYGMYSGLALLMDVHRPEAGRGNGYGIVHISGSGWSAPLGLDARPLKEASHVEIEARPLVEAGYTVCSINHRAAPRFPYPAAVEDAQRAVRFMRHNAERLGIRKDRIGAIGGSSGGHLVSMLGVLDGSGDAEDESPVNRESARVQCVVARAAPTSFLTMPNVGARVAFLGAQVGPSTAPGSVEYRRAVEASPVRHVAAGAPPFFLIHGDADETVPIAQSEEMAAALEKVGVPVKLRRVAGGVHGPGIVRDQGIAAEIREWFETHLT
jgi:acetyl esterase/lipase